MAYGGLGIGLTPAKPAEEPARTYASGDVDELQPPVDEEIVDYLQITREVSGQS